MFRARTTSRILPQFEHSRLAGMLAWHWGNDDFDRPDLPFDSFARGVTLHDWHYGMLDDHPLGAYDQREWLAIARAGINVDYDDPVTDVVAKKHLRRLMGTPELETTAELIQQLDDKIQQRIQDAGHTTEAFDWADAITRFCDSVAFMFGFQKRGWHDSEVHARHDDSSATTLEYQIVDERTIQLAPWPLSRESVTEQVLLFPEAGYPDTLQPRVELVRCLPGRE